LTVLSSSSVLNIVPTCLFCAHWKANSNCFRYIQPLRCGTWVPASMLQRMA